MKEYSFGAVRAIRNEHVSASAVPDFLSVAGTKNARRVHCALSVYGPTPLVRLDGLAQRLGVKAVFVKDESKRFGLNAFKALGGLYSLFCLICRELGIDAQTATFEDLKKPGLLEKIRTMTFVTTTDGNHGRGVAWAAHQLGCEAHVYMPVGSSPARAEAIRAFGAECVITEAGYDDTVRMTAGLAAEHGWFLVQDTSWPGYSDVPTWIVQGYTTMAEEAAAQLEAAGFAAPTHVFVQAGVGAMAGGVTGYLAARYDGRRPKFITVEPENMACIYRSAQVNDGEPHVAIDTGDTIMAGLNCGEPCTIAWPVLRDFCSWYAACPDYVAANGMRLLAAPLAGDPQVISGESGAVTAGLLAEVCGQKNCAELKKMMGLDETSVVLLFSTEGDTDPAGWERIVHRGAYPAPF